MSALSAARLELASCPPSLGGDVSLPLSCMRSRLGSACSPHAGRARSQRELHCLSDPRALFPPAHSFPYPLPTHRSAGGCAPGAHKAWHPASDPSWPPRPGSVEGREYGLHPELALLILFHRVWNVQTGRALGVWPAQPLVHRQETGPQGLPSLSSLALPWADPGLEFKAPGAHRAPFSSHPRWS